MATPHGQPENPGQTTKPKHAGGRPSKFNEQIADEILTRISSGETLTKICAEAGMPDRVTVFRWKRSNAKFCNDYAQARIDQMEAFSDEILAIADDSSNDTKTMTGAGGEEYEVENHEWVNRSKLKVDSRKWLMAKLASKIYGDKIQQEISGDSERPVVFTIKVGDGKVNERVEKAAEEQRTRSLSGTRMNFALPDVVGEKIEADEGE